MAAATAEESVPVSALRPANTSSIVICAVITSDEHLDRDSLSLGDIKRIARNIEWKLQKAIYGLPKGEERTMIIQTLNEIADAEHRSVIERMKLQSNENPPIDEEAARERLPAIQQLKCAENDRTKLDQESIDTCLALIREKNAGRVASK